MFEDVLQGAALAALLVAGWAMVNIVLDLKDIASTLTLIRCSFETYCQDVGQLLKVDDDDV
jgi:hypothetical protein